MNKSSKVIIKPKSQVYRLKINSNYLLPYFFRFNEIVVSNSNNGNQNKCLDLASPSSK